MADQVVDLEEAVGSYLNCLSTSCAAGSKLYTSVGKLVDEKFQELFPSQETKIFFQVLQTQNACEGYQKALLECKEKLLEILIDNHTKRQPTKDKVRPGKRSSPEEQYAGVALRVAKELYCYHQTVAEVLKPLHFSDCQEDIENATLMNIEGKSDVVQAWMTIVEGNKLLRSGYGLSNAEVSQILCWQHGEDMTESSRKRLNQQVNQLIQQYVDRMYNHAMCELDIPIAFSNHPDEIQKILQSCCSPTESLASSAQTFLTQKEEITTMLHRELPRTILTLNNKKIDKAHPGKAYENATLKMRAVRESISNAIDAKQIDNSKEQVDLFCLRILAMGSLSYASAACRTAVLMAFGKSNLVQVQPIVESDKHIILDVNKDTVNVNINTKWAIVEDGVLFNSLCRGNLTQIATIYVTYHVEINIEQFFVKRITPIPVAHVTQCILQQAPSNQNKKEQGRERSKSIRIKLTRATKLFQRKSVVKTDAEADFYAKDFMQGGGGGGHGGSLSDDLDLSSKTPSENGYTSDSQGECSPVPPPRHKRKAKKTKKSRATTDPSNNNNNGSPSSGSGASSGIPKEKKSKEAKKEDLAWFSASDRFGIPLVPTVSGSKDQSPSIASFEELQGVIDFLSGSSTSSLAINEKGEKIIRTGGGQNLKTHKRNNSTTSLPQTDTKGKTNAEGKLKLCHKKSASFSGKASDLAGSTDTPTTDNPKKSSVGSLTNDTFTTQKKEKQGADKEQPKETSSSATESSSDSCSKSPTDLVVAVGVERTPGDGMDHKINKDLFQSTSSIDNNITQKPQVSQAQQSDSDSKTAEKQQNTTGDSTVAKNETQTAQKEESTGDTPENVNNKKEPYFEPSDITGEIAHLRLSKQSDIDVVKSLPSDLNAHAQTNVQPFYQQQKSSTLAALEITTTVNQQKENMPSNVNWQQQQQLQQKPNDAPSPLNIHPKQTAPPQLPQQQPRVPINSSLDPSAFEFEKQQQKPPQLPASSDQQNTLYEPFNSRTAWPGFGANPGVANGVSGGAAQGQFGGGSRFKSLWSEATMDNDKGFPHDERPSLVNTLPPSSTSGIRSSETEFTFDKQQDLHKLLEGSSFMKGGYQQNNFQDSWKDR
ncbi:uncharacterized protein [Clytia hemisphaerica]|uniref:Uncharacterized protein n=1 Tax=Clytia hemisphaerica TaxID=252671 RepID=A0A7M5WUV0_9CNID